MKLTEIDWGCRLMDRQVEFQRAKRVLEIGGGDYGRIIALAQVYPQKQFFSIDFRYGDEAKQNVARAAVLDNVSFVKADVLDGIFGRDAFDFAFSIAVMEHVPRLEEFLSVVFGILRPRGVYSFFQAPFWTSRTGHHFNHDDPAVNAVLDAYQHIGLDAEGMQAYLAGRRELPFDAGECVRKIYWREDISRLSPGETRRIVDNSPFTLLEWSERPDPDFDDAKATAAMKVHGDRYSLDDFRIAGVFARLLKQA